MEALSDYLSAGTVRRDRRTARHCMALRVLVFVCWLVLCGTYLEVRVGEWILILLCVLLAKTLTHDNRHSKRQFSFSMFAEICNGSMSERKVFKSSTIYVGTSTFLSVGIRSLFYWCVHDCCYQLFTLVLVLTYM